MKQLTVKKIYKAAVSAFAVASCMFLLGTPSVVQAGNAGSSQKNAQKVSMGKEYSHNFTVKGARVSPYFVKFTVKNRGVVNFDISKPTNKKLISKYYTLKLKNAKGKNVWSTYGRYYEKPGKNFSYKLGLDKGTYYMEIAPEYYTNTSKKISVPTKFKFTYKKTNNFEVEGNNTMKTATELKMGQKISGVYGEEEGDQAFDYFKMSFEKGKKYAIRIYDIKDLLDADIFWYLVNPAGKDRLMNYDFNEKTGYYEVVIQANTTGNYYIKLGDLYNKAPVDYTIGYFLTK